MEHTLLKPAHKRDGALRGSARLALVLVLNLAQMTNYVNRVCLSISIDGDSGIAAEMGWSDTTKGLVLSSFFYGYVAAHTPMGWLVVRYGARRMQLCGYTAQVLLALAFPTVVRSGSLGAVFMVRVLLGVAQATQVPSMIHLLAAWLPTNEATGGMAGADIGGSLGAATTLATAPLLMRLGWPVVFYTSAALSAVWLLFGLRYLHDSPASSPRVSAGEARYLRVQGKYNAPARGQRTPWRRLFCNAQVLCLLPVFFAINYPWYVFLTFLPQYLHNQLGFDLSSSGLASALPYATVSFSAVASAILSDRLIASRRLSMLHTRKLFQALGAIPTAGLLLAMVYSPDSSTAVALLCLSNLFFGCLTAGASVVPMQITVRYAGLLEGVLNGVGNSAGIVAPLVTGLLLDGGGCPRDDADRQPISESCHAAWYEVFYISASTFVFGLGIFLAFGSTEPLDPRLPGEDTVSCPALLGRSEREGEDAEQERGAGAKSAT